MLAKVINLDLIGNPYNWFVIFFMVAIAAFVWGMVDPLKSTAPQGEPA
jgi:hypothetical protein